MMQRALAALWLVGAVVACSRPGAPTPSAAELVTLGRHEEARAAGAQLAEKGEQQLPGQGFWREQLDGGDAPLQPGCACSYQNAGCAGPIEGRAVDECFPRDGDTLHEKTVPTQCGNYGSRQYSCRQLLGPGAECRLLPLECCGVQTTSGYCWIDVTAQPAATPAAPG